MLKERAEEIIKCKQSAAYFAQQYCWIRHLELGAIRFVPWDWQLSLIHLWQAGKSTISTKSRQIGASWTAMAYIAWIVNFHPEVEIILLSQKEEKAIKLLAKLTFIMEHLPDWLRARTLADSKRAFSAGIRYYDEVQDKWITGEGKVSSLTTTGTSGAGDSVRVVVIDEFALMTERRNDVEVFAAVAPTTTHGGLMIILSTPRGAHGEHYRIWGDCLHDVVELGIASEEIKSYREWNQRVIGNASWLSMVPTALHYSMCYHDEDWIQAVTRGLSRRKAEKLRAHFSEIKYDAAWRDEQARRMKLSPAQVDQEFELVFESLGNAAFPAHDITACYMDPRYHPFAGELIARSEKFYIGVDTAEGITLRSKEPDYNSIVVFNQSGIQVHAEHNRENIDEWAGSTVINPMTGKPEQKNGTVWHVINRFRPCLVIVEKNGPGLTVINRIKHVLPSGVSLKVMSMSGGTKPQLVSDFAAEMADEQLCILLGGVETTIRKLIFTDHFTVRCLRHYLKLGPGKFGAATGFFDDPVVAALWAAYGKRITGAMDMVAALPEGEDRFRPIGVDEHGDLAPEILRDDDGLGPISMDDLESIAVTPVDETGLFGSLTGRRSLGGRRGALRGRLHDR